MSAAPPGDGAFFRHEYGRLVAALSRRVGLRHLQAIEDAAQSALMAAVERWPVAGSPRDPSAWLYRVAHNQLLDTLRGRTRRARLLEHHRADAAPAAPAPAAPRLASEVSDDLLRMLFVCCDAAVPVESRLALALKTLCGFGVGEIAHRLFTTDANVYKRLARARAQLRAGAGGPQVLFALAPDTLAERLESVHQVLYLLFTEGYLSVRADAAIRRELCDEAVRLATVLADHPVGDNAKTCALLALLHLHGARLSARTGDGGALVLLDEQDRTSWDADHIARGLQWLARSARGNVFSRFHGEAAIAAEHCLAPTFDDTRWDVIADLYARLERVAPSPLYTLNRALAVAEARGPAAGLAVLEGIAVPSWLEGSYQVSAALADLHHRCGHEARASVHRDRALALAPTDAIAAALRKRLSRPRS